ncbi:MAG: SDR family NAD(P)-dependent oxidoreductase [Pseudomonadota bacterium]
MSRPEPGQGPVGGETGQADAAAQGAGGEATASVAAQRPAFWERVKRLTGPRMVGPAQDGKAPAVVVTGASEGIGRALAEAFATAGHRVVMIARREAPLEQAAAGLRLAVKRTTGRDGDVRTLPLDVTAADALSQLDAHLKAEALYIDHLINNAGVGHAGPFVEQDHDGLIALLRLNIEAASRLMHHVLPAMIARRSGGVLNVSSLGGLVPGPYQAAYYASKAYLNALSEAAAAECAGTGVRISVLMPGPVETRFHEKMGGETGLYRSVLPAMAAADVARAGLRGYTLGARVIMPGVLNGVSALFLRLLPHTVSVPVMALLLRPRAPLNTGTAGHVGDEAAPRPAEPSTQERKRDGGR